MTPATERLPAHLEPLRQQCIEVYRRIERYTPSVSGICISDQEGQTDLHRRWQFLCSEYTRLAREAGVTTVYTNDLMGRPCTSS